VRHRFDGEIAEEPMDGVGRAQDLADQSQLPDAGPVEAATLSFALQAMEAHDANRHSTASSENQ